MEKDRLAAFSDGVIAVIITIMVLELKPPTDMSWSSLQQTLPSFLSYVLSFIYVGIYWNNHHHLLHTVKRVNGTLLWANMHLLFWLSLIPFATSWARTDFTVTAPAALYGAILFLSALAYYMLQRLIICSHTDDAILKEAIGKDLKGKLSPVFYLIAIAFAFMCPQLSYGIYVGVALLWLVPDRRIENKLNI